MPAPLLRRLALLAALPALAAGCGSGDHGPPPLDAAQVARGFAQLTGDRLVSDPGASQSGIQVLSLAQGTGDATALQQRYGTFSIYVVGGGADAATLTAKDPSGATVRPDAHGIYWRRLSASPPAWQAAKRYRNVVLQWEAGDRRALDDRFTRLDAALTRTVDPRARVRLPAADTPCARLGIDPATHGTGTCKQGAQTVVVVTRGHRLVLPSVTISRVTVRRARRVGSGRFGQRAVARGRFVVITFRASNHGDAPLDRLDSALTLDPRRYAADDTAQLVLQPRTPLPLQPGAAATFRTAYDLPVPAAARAVRHGSLLIADETGAGAATVDDAAVVGRIRFHR